MSQSSESEAGSEASAKVLGARIALLRWGVSKGAPYFVEGRLQNDPSHYLLFAQ